MPFGITDAGFVIKDLQTIRSEHEVEFKNTYGSDLDVSEESVTGQLIGILSKREANLWEFAQAVYNFFSPDNASGISLDHVCAMVGIVRLPATTSDVTVALYGNIGTNIPVGHLVRQEETSEEFALDTAVTIGLSSVVDIDFSVSTVLDNQLYTVTINGTGYDYTSDGTATAIEIIAGLKVSVDAGSEPVIFTDNLDGSARIFSANGLTAFSIAVDSNLQVDVQASPGSYQAVNTGEITVPANTVNEIVTPIAGLNSVNNLGAGFAGRTIETDEELRIRRRESLTGIGAATDEAIRTALLQEVDEVTNAIVISNRTDFTDGDGRPPHSFESVVSGGDEQDIADKIWEKMPSGIETFGSITKTVVDSTGTNQTIKFSRPTNVYIWVEVDYTLNSEETFPATGETGIKENIVAYGTDEFNIGDDVIRQRLAIPIYEVPGIKDITIRLASTTTPTPPPGSYAEVNITIASNELAVWDESRITVTQV